MGAAAPDIVAELPRPHGQEAIWQCLREGGRERVWTVKQIYSAINLNQRVRETAPRTIRSYLDRLQRAGLVERCADNPAKYRLTRDSGARTPRIGGDGRRIEGATGNQRMWMALRALKLFSPADLALTSETKFETARKYCSFLRKAGYLKVAQESVPGRQTVYRFNEARNTGPQAPQIKRSKALYDPNIEKVVFVRIEESAA